MNAFGDKGLNFGLIFSGLFDRFALERPLIEGATNPFKLGPVNAGDLAPSSIFSDAFGPLRKEGLLIFS